MHNDSQFKNSFQKDQMMAGHQTPPALGSQGPPPAQLKAAGKPRLEPGRQILWSVSPKRRWEVTLPRGSRPQHREGVVKNPKNSTELSFWVSWTSGQWRKARQPPLLLYCAVHYAEGHSWTSPREFWFLNWCVWVGGGDSESSSVKEGDKCHLPDPIMDLWVRFCVGW